MTLLSSSTLSGARVGTASDLDGLLSGLTGGGLSSGPMAGGGGMGGMGGIGWLLESFEQAGYGDVLPSWMGPGQNHDISPNQLGEAIDDVRHYKAGRSHPGMNTRTASYETRNLPSH